MYKDGKILAYIEEGKAANGDKKDRLIIENISSNALTVKYALRSVVNEHNTHNFIKDKMIYDEETIKPGERKTNAGYQSKETGYYFVHSFSIMRVAVAQSDTKAEQTATVPLQRNMYNDGKVLAYIEEGKDYKGKTDRLVIENISNSAVTVKYSLRSVVADQDNNIKKDKMKYAEVMLAPKGKKAESSAQETYSEHYFVYSFSIMNVSVYSPSSRESITTYSSPPKENTAKPKQSTSVPQWAQGSWYDKDGNFAIKITSTQMIGLRYAFDCNKVNDDHVFFGDSYFAVSKTNKQNEIYYIIYNDKNKKADSYLLHK
jgi:hypothetical protein